MSSFWESSQWRGMEAYRQAPVPATEQADYRTSHGLARDTVLKDGEATYVKQHFARCIFECGKLLGARVVVSATAATYFQRFYTRRTLCEQHPMIMAPACILLASKVEECMEWPTRVMDKWHQAVSAKGRDVQLKTLCEELVTIEALVEGEGTLLSVVHDSLILFHPYRPLQLFLANAGAPEVTANAWKLINDSFFVCDACLAHPPYVVALACIYVASVMIGKDMRQWYTEIHVEACHGGLLAVAEVMQKILKGYDVHNQHNVREQLLHALEKLR